MHLEEIRGEQRLNNDKLTQRDSRTDEHESGNRRASPVVESTATLCSSNAGKRQCCRGETESRTIGARGRCRVPRSRPGLPASWRRGSGSGGRRICQIQPTTSMLSVRPRKPFDRMDASCSLMSDPPVRFSAFKQSLTWSATLISGIPPLTCSQLADSSKAMVSGCGRPLARIVCTM